MGQNKGKETQLATPFGSDAEAQRLQALGYKQEMVRIGSPACACDQAGYHKSMLGQRIMAVSLDQL